ncbi:hypothetical protein CDEST_06403 [Colletotrichum destructivum]|uniref:Uncharacterized protein n=1 Tax=Colletotrichum destructivum TaxID=34406 RepID=A0AAX4IDS1_9PEZI|nr:hypothetical protein CDEST_06403 [Colletotrichum destructivum]
MNPSSWLGNPARSTHSVPTNPPCPRSQNQVGFVPSSQSLLFCQYEYRTDILPTASSTTATRTGCHHLHQQDQSFLIRRLGRLAALRLGPISFEDSTRGAGERSAPPFCFFCFVFVVWLQESGAPAYATTCRRINLAPYVPTYSMYVSIRTDIFSVPILLPSSPSRSAHSPPYALTLIILISTLPPPMPM